MVKSRHNDFHVDIDALVLPSITASQPVQPLDVSSWDIPNNIPLADPQFHKPGRIDLLLGAETFFRLLCVGQIHLGPTKPCLQKTLLGWVLSGAVNNVAPKLRSTSLSASLNDGIETNMQSLNEKLKTFWEMEEIASDERTLTPEEQRCEDIFAATTTRNSSGRFIVRLPLRNNPLVLGDSYKNALKRFMNLQQKLNRSPQFNDDYNTFMGEYRDLGHMEGFGISHSDPRRYFIPHHGIYQSSGPSKKLRVVFDASCKTSFGNSLNDILMPGPALQEELFSILCRFRQRRFVLTADMVNMYRQILVHPDHTRLQSILWRDDTSKDLETFELKTVTYGTSCAPYLAIRCIKELTTIYKAEYPAASRILNQDICVDDILTGADSEIELKRIQSELINLLNKGGISLHKWCSNSSTSFQFVDENEISPHIITGNDKTTKVLGMVWQPTSDLFRYQLRTPQKMLKATKRSVLSVIASLFDPLGLVNPILVSAKILMQEMWKSGIGWDESLPMVLHSKWNNFLLELSDLEEIRIRRFVSRDTDSDVQLHGFCDASQSAYGACIFIRTCKPSSGVTTQLLCAKSRVSPVKTQTLPRLELCGALLLIDLIDKVVRSLDFKPSSIYCWTDSSVTLSWIAGSPATWTTFVAHRVTSIQAKSESHSVIWRHVSTKENPADILSRGASPKQLKDNRLWFCGPSFLNQAADEWPNLMTVPPIELEKRKAKFTCLIAGNAKQDLMSRIKFINSYRRTVRVMAYVHRFLSHCQKKDSSRSPQLTAEDLNRGEELFIRMIQRHQYVEEISALEQGKPLNKRSKILNLHPFIDDELILRVGGRLNNAELAFSTKHPMLLPRTHAFTKSLVKHMHEKFSHAGCLTLHNIIRQKYWIPNARQLIRSTIHHCLRCFRSKPRTLQQLMGDLPEKRVNPSNPFSHVGIDYCGPFKLKAFVRSKIELKAYLSAFICFATKAVHLKVVSNLTTEAFIAALKRFIGRRGLCSSITSDNATNFVGANRQLSELKRLFLSDEHNRLVREYCNSEGIRWQFIPPRSPHFGGLWEASVKRAKYFLTRILTHERLNYEEFTTVMIQVESMLNSRPLTAISEDPNDLEALTPGHFLIGRGMHSLSEPSLEDISLSRLSRWQHLSRLQQHFWARWTKEYLHDLQRRAKWMKGEPNIKQGALVIIKEDNVPPNEWLLGRVERVFPGKDGRVRVAEVKTKHGAYTRPISKLCPLPLEDSAEDSGR